MSKNYYDYYCYAFATVRSGAALDKLNVSSDERINCSYALGAEDACTKKLKSKKEFMEELDQKVS